MPGAGKWYISLPMRDPSVTVTDIPPAATPAISGAMDLKSWAVLLTLSVVWGGSFFFVEVALQTYGPLTIVGARVFIAAAALQTFIALTRRDWPVSLDFWRMIVVMAITNNIIPFILIVWGQVYLSGALASILNATTPLFALVLANIMTQDEKMTPRKVMALLCGFTGVVVIIAPDMHGGMDAEALAHLAPLAAAVSYAYSSIYARRFARFGSRPVMIASSQLTISTLVLVPLALVFEQPWTIGAPPMEAALAILALALLSSTLAYIAYFWFIAKNGGTNTTLVTFLVPVSATGFGIGFLGEHLLPQHIAGVVFIALCFFILDGRIFAKIRSKFSQPIENAA